MAGSAILEMAALAVVALLAGWWLGKTSVGAALAVSQQHAKGLETRNTQLEGEIRDLREKQKSAEIEKTRSQEQLNAAQQSLVEERASFTQLKGEMKDAFTTLASDSLEATNRRFLTLANQKFDAKQEAIDTLLKPVKETLDKMEGQTRHLENERVKAYGEVLTEIRNIQKTHETLRQETTQLVQALRAPKARGNWGELQLKRCIEFAGMVEHCSFETEKHMPGTEDEGAQRPDVVVQLPNGRVIIIDAKTPLDAFLSAMSCGDEAQKAVWLKAHAAQVRTHLSQLGGKQYWQRFQNSPERNSPEFVVCFLPSEVLFSAALEQDPELIEVGSRLNVILATPTTLIALLKAVAYGWQQMEITRNAIEICKAGEDLYKKLAGMQKHFANLGSALTRSVEHFHNLVGAVAGKDSVFDKAAKLHKLGIGQDEIPEIKQIEATARVVESNHWDEPIALAASEEAPEE